MQKHIIPLITTIVLLGLTSCQPDVVETEMPKEPTTETPIEEKPEDTEKEPPTEPSINDWNPGSSSSTDLIEK